MFICLVNNSQVLEKLRGISRGVATNVLNSDILVDGIVDKMCSTVAQSLGYFITFSVVHPVISNL